MITTISLSPAVDKVYFTDNFKAGGLFRVGNIVRSAGGKGVNVARVSSLLGHETSCIGFKAGWTGEWIEGQLKKLGIKTCFLEIEGESRTNNNIIDRANGTETELLEIGPYVDVDNINRFMNTFEDNLKYTTVLVCSGGLPDGAPATMYRRLVEIAVQCNVKTILDSNGAMLEEGIKAKPYMIKPNLRELCALTGKQLNSDNDIIAACKEINSAGIRMVLASLGNDGAILVTDRTAFKTKLSKIDVVNTIGSGDSMVAGCAAGLVRGYSPEEMLKLGTACAVANTQFMEVGMIDCELVEKFLKLVELEKI